LFFLVAPNMQSVAIVVRCHCPSLGMEHTAPTRDGHPAALGKVPRQGIKPPAVVARQGIKPQPPSSSSSTGVRLRRWMTDWRVFLLVAEHQQAMDCTTLSPAVLDLWPASRAARRRQWIHGLVACCALMYWVARHGGLDTCRGRRQSGFAGNRRLATSLDAIGRLISSLMYRYSNNATADEPRLGMNHSAYQ
jgi:hypothetical protein